LIFIIEKVDQANSTIRVGINQVKKSEFGNVRKWNMTQKDQGIAKK